MAILRSPPNVPRVLSSHHSRSSPHSSRLLPLPCTIRKMIHPPLLPHVSRALPDNLADGALDFRPRPSVSHPSPSSAIDFLTLCHRLKTTKRKGWINHGIEGPESIADHMYRMALMALILDIPGVDRERCIKLAIVHDIAEAMVGDITPSDGVPKAEKSKRKQAALTEMCKILRGGCQDKRSLGRI